MDLKENFDKILIAFLLMLMMGLLCIYKDAHDIVVFMMGAVTTLLGSLTTLTHSSPNKNATISTSTPANGGTTPTGEFKSGNSTTTAAVSVN